jgi:hypothetical protein
MSHAGCGRLCSPSWRYSMGDDNWEHHERGHDEPEQHCQPDPRALPQDRHPAQPRVRQEGARQLRGERRHEVWPRLHLLLHGHHAAHAPSFKEACEKPFDLGYAIVDSSMPDRVARDAETTKPESRGLVQLCTTTDAWAPEAKGRCGCCPNLRSEAAGCGCHRSWWARLLPDDLCVHQCLFFINNQMR